MGTSSRRFRNTSYVDSFFFFFIFFFFHLRLFIPSSNGFSCSNPFLHSPYRSCPCWAKESESTRPAKTGPERMDAETDARAATNIAGHPITKAFSIIAECTKMSCGKCCPIYKGFCKSCKDTKISNMIKSVFKGGVLQKAYMEFCKKCPICETKCAKSLL